MSATTPFLNLYKPGGGSTGLIVPDEVVDVDRFNTNFDSIDDWAQTTDTFRLAQLGRNQQYRGLTADIGSVSSPVRGDTYQETDGAKRLMRYNGSVWSNLNAAVKVRRNASQSIPTGTFTEISWDTEVFDTGSLWDVSNPTRLLAPVAGVYQILAIVSLNAAIAERIALKFRKNGSTDEYGGVLGFAGGASEAGASSGTLVQMAANDYLEVQIYQESGSSQATGGAAYSMPTATWAIHSMD